MARVLVPVRPRRYDFNPKGSSAAVVTLAGDNPFERPTVITNQRRSYMPGLGALGADAPVASPGIDWAAIATGVAQAGTQVAQTAATNAVNKVLPPPKSTAIPTTSSVPMQIVNPNYGPAPSSKMPLILGGVAVAVLGLGAFLVLRKKRK